MPTDRETFLDGAAEVAKTQFHADGSLKGSTIRVLVVNSGLVNDLYETHNPALVESAVKLVRKLAAEANLTYGQITSMLLAASTTGVADLFFNSEHGASVEDLQTLAAGFGAVCVAMMNSAEQLMAMAEHAKAEAEFAEHPTVH